MHNNEYLANRLREVLLDGRWIANTNFKDQIQDLSLEQATRKIGNLNSIATLTFHINYYLQGLLHVFNGGELLIKDKHSFDLPQMHTEDDWLNMKTEFLRRAEAFIDKVNGMSEALLSSTFIDEKYGTYQRNIEAVIEHGYYHLGQVVLIKKMILASPT